MIKRIWAQSDFEKGIISIFHSGRTFRQTRSFIESELIKKIYSEVRSVTPSGKRRYSNKMRGFVYGYIAANFYQIQQNEVEFCYEIDVELFTTSKRKDSIKRKIKEFMDEKKPTCQEMDGYKKGLYWFNTNKFYF